MADIIEAASPSDAIILKVNGRTVDPNEHYAKNALKTDHIVLTLYSGVNPEQHAILKSLEVQFQEDLGNCNYLCCYEPTNLEPIRALEWVRQVDVYRNKFKIPEVLLSSIDELNTTPQSTEEKTVLVNILPHQEYDSATGLQELAAKIATAVGVNSSKVEVLTSKVQVEVQAREIEKIAALEPVRVIEEVLTPQLADGQANEIVLCAATYPTMPAFRGSNQVISVIDSGFDLGTSQDCHPAFEGCVKKLISLNRSDADVPTDAQRYDDPDGHGTHVCGTIVGQQAETSAGLIEGVAPDAQIVVSSLMASEVRKGIVKDIDKAFRVPFYECGARIFSNSWGDKLYDKKQRPYSTDAELLDTFVKDHPDALIIFSAGNNNETMSYPPYLNKTPKDGPTISSQAAAKNCLTVGASGTTRKAGRNKKEFLPDEIWDDSSRGRTIEFRIKPDVVAPGYTIFSAKTRHPKAKTTIDETHSSDYPSQIGWEPRSGTSHSTPLVAGCAAILREFAEKTNGSPPSAALLKAVIINGADKLPNVDDRAQGFGRVNVSASTEMLKESPVSSSEAKASLKIPRNCGTLIGDALKNGENFEMTLQLDLQSQDAPLDFKVTLVYNDMKGAVIQNNLNLSVINPITGSAAHGYESEDDVQVQNNVEQVKLQLVSSTTLRVRVTGQKVFPQQSQDFVLAWALLRPYVGFQKT